MREQSRVSLLVFTILLSGSLAAFSTTAKATLITFEVTGTLTGFDGPVLAPLDIGQPYVASFTFDSNAPATPVFGGGNDFVGAITSASFSIGSYNATLADPADTTIRVLDDFFGNTDIYDVFLGDPNFGSTGAISAPPVTGPIGELFPTRALLIDLEDFSDPLDGLSSSDLPLTPPDVSKFDSAGWLITFEAPDESLFGQARGSIDSFAIAQQVPEPTTLTLSGAGLMGLLALGWKRRRGRHCQ
jgi:hypothetical protein